MATSMQARAAVAQPLERPRLELDGTKLARALEALVSGAEEHGGVERYVAALQVKAALFRDALGSGRAGEVDSPTLKALCAHIATVRRRVAPYLDRETFDLRSRLAALLEGCDDTATTDSRVAAFCAGFPEDRAHRWVRDLAGEVLHNVDPERYPLMTRWVWDARANTGVVREIWYAENVDHVLIDVSDGYATFLMLREELSQFLAANGVYRDVLFYVDLLTAQVYAGYVSEQGGSYLRTDFATPEEPMLHTRRLLGLDGMAASGRTRLKAVDGTAFVVDDSKLLG